MSVEVDPALAMRTYDAAPPGSQRYFRCEDGDLDYTIVARDEAHARSLLIASGVEAYDDHTGQSVPFDKATWLVWSEISEERAAQIRVRDDDTRGTSPDGNGWPLHTFRPGDWFCSEW